MDTTPLGYRQKWRLRRRQRLLKRAPFVALGVIAVAVVVSLALLARRPQVKEAAWAHGDGSRGMPRMGLSADGNSLLVAWERGGVTAHSPETGEALWFQPFERPREFEGPPGVAVDCVVFGGMDGVIRCLELDTGFRRWWHPTGALVRSRPLIDGDRAYVGADNGRVYALGLGHDGKRPMWVYPELDLADREPILGGPAIWEDTLICGSADRTVVALDADTGKLRWRVRLPAPIVARATATEGLAYLATEVGDVYCLRMEDGDAVWTWSASGLVRTPVRVAGSAAYALASDGTVTCLDASNGGIRWQRELDGRPTTSAVTDATRIYVGTSDESVQALTLDTGRVVWRWRPGAKPLGDLVLGPGRLFCATSSGRVFSVPLPGTHD